MIDAAYVTKMALFIKGRKSFRVDDLARHMHNPAYPPGGAVDFNELMVFQGLQLLVENNVAHRSETEKGVYVMNDVLDKMARV